MTGASYHDEILIEALEENLHDDPYGTAVYVIRNILTRALDDRMSGSMSEHEFAILDSIATLMGEQGIPPEPTGG